MGNTGDGLNLQQQSSVEQGGGLTTEQRASLAKVQAKLGVDEFSNSNMADTSAHLAEHGFVFKTSGPASTPKR